MNAFSALLVRAWFLVAVLLIILLPSWNSKAATHIVTFVCCQYNPSHVEAAVGDTMVWQGAFAEHPLSSSTIPSGAAPFLNATGTSFSYVIQFAGMYNYRCLFHQPSMAGSFNAQTVGVNEREELPEAFALKQNYPNPFNPVTSIRSALPKEAHVTLRIYNAIGQEVATLVNRVLKAGYHTVVWDGHDKRGSSVGSGIYIYRIDATPGDGSEAFFSARKMILLK